MSDLKFRYRSARSEKARISVKFNSTIIIVLSIISFALMVIGVDLLVITYPIGWTFIGLSVIPAIYSQL